MMENIVKRAQDDAVSIVGSKIYVALVSATSGGLIKIKRFGQQAADSTFRPAASGLAAAVSPGDKVLCLEGPGGVYVICKFVFA